MSEPDEFEIYPQMAQALVSMLPDGWRVATLVLRPAGGEADGSLEHIVIGPTAEEMLEPSPELYRATRLLFLHFARNPPMFEEARLTVELKEDGKWRHRTALRYPPGVSW